MGAGASAAADDAPSANDVSKWSKEEVGAQVAAIGEAFEPYQDIAIKNGIDGKTLLSLDGDDMEEFGISMKAHRKMIRKRLDDIQSQQAAMPSDTAADAATGAAPTPSGRLQLFLSYPRGDETTPFARKLKAFLEERGFAVWMDEQGIAGGVDFMSAIGSAIKASRGIIAVIDEKFCGSAYCNDELAMAKGR